MKEKYSIIKSLLIAIVLVITFAFSGCGKDEPQPEPTKEEPTKEFRLELTQSTIQVELGMSKKAAFLIHNYHPNLDEYPKLIWTSSNTSIASVDENGNITGIAIGKTKVSLKIKDSKTEVSTEVEVVPSTAKSLSLSTENKEVSIGQKVKVNYKIEPSSVTNITDKDIEWTSSNEKILTVINGEITGIAVGRANVTAKIKGTEINGSMEIKVTPQIIFAEIGKQLTAPDGLLLTIQKVDISKNSDGTQYYNIQYNLKNQVKDSRIIEGGFRLFKTDGTFIEQYGIFNYLYTGEQTTKSYNFKALSNEIISFLEYRPDISKGAYNSVVRLKLK